MRISEAPVADVRGPLTAQRRRLLSLLTSLSDVQWAAPTAAPQWPVKDIALHLLDVDLSWLARDRDHDQAGTVPVPADHEEFVCGLAQRNQRWVDGTRILSPRLITDLLRWSGDQLDDHLGTVDLAGSSSVYWAGEAPLWFDLAREFTERWVHYRQIQEAVLPAGHDPPADGAWILTKTATGWSLDEGHAAAPAASLRLSGEAAWRLLTGARYDACQVQLSGDPALTEPLLRVRGIIV